jgi:light-regulated signal transduction histidine kinase (bacteriophytochrome)
LQSSAREYSADAQLDTGDETPNLQWHVRKEIIGSACHRTRRELPDLAVTTDLSADLPLLWLDGLLMEQVFVNLLESVARYTSICIKVRLSAAIDGRLILISVANNGQEFPRGAEHRIFESFLASDSLVGWRTRRRTGLGNLSSDRHESWRQHQRHQSSERRSRVCHSAADSRRFTTDSAGLRNTALRFLFVAALT